MKRRALREHIGMVVCLFPRPKFDGKLWPQGRNFWTILSEFGNGAGLMLQNILTEHEGEVPYDSIREFREPETLILRATLKLGKNGEFILEPFVDVRDENDVLPTEREILPERLAHAKTGLSQCTPDEIRTIRELLIREKMTKDEIEGF